ncbi:atrial natriuretic peptide receptor 1-like isoform X2 [Mercenaria mercenaria]|uniref:atrial natriuretic peptide receptor 1-like isoform X2 n=1 Tax=Mercenaria mercenaria TaxID=6596 RepID=UPI00234F05F8|nr:atrial natriuretic peptide receptor 1-like isoform X2 [Mercenaria mercenaria]
MWICCFFKVYIIYIFIKSVYCVDPNHLVTEIEQPLKVQQTTAQGCRRNVKAKDDKEFRIAWLAPEQEFHNFSAATSTGAVKLALAFIVQHEILHGYTLRAKWYDSKCDSKQALVAFVEAVESYDPDVIMGPPCSTGLLGVAQLGSIWNLPVFSWVSDLLDFKDKDKYTTLVRLSGPLYAIAETMRQIGLFFKWNNFALIYDKQAPYEAVAVALREAAVDKNYTIKSTHYISAETTDDHMVSMLQQIKKFARVIIFVVPWHSLRHYLLLAHELGMANGEYAFLCVHGDLFNWDVMDEKILSDWGWRRDDAHDEKAREIYESVIHVIMEPLEKHTSESFRNFTTGAAAVKLPEWELPFNGTDVDAYAPYLYDAIITWAQSVNYTLEHGGNPRDGAHIYQVVPKAVNLKGVTGDIVFNLPEMERMLNYRVLDMRENGTFYKLFQFYFKKDKEMEFKFDDIESFEKRGRWPTTNGNPPPDIPVCGFDGEKCEERVYNNSYNSTVIGASVSASVVLVLAIVVHMMLRRYRRQMNLQSMLWQVRFDEIDFVTAWICGSLRNSFRNLRKPSSKTLKRRRYNAVDKEIKDIKHITENGKKGSPEFQHLKSIDASAMFGSVAFVRGNLASVKKIQRVNSNMTKGVLQELNQLMEMKHQNVCAFVGACIEPNRALLLWEYCAKGSLQDVIWNQNIKLDQMFMFALSHDVAKGLEYIHKSQIHYHGNLKSTNCVVDSRWTCKLTDLGVPNIREMGIIAAQQTNEEIQWEKMLWKAPECLRDGKDRPYDKQKADIYALGIILKEIFTRSSPYTEYPFLVAHEICEKIKCPVKGEKEFRPMLSLQLRQHTELASLITDCWSEDPPSRPSATRVGKLLNKINPQNLSMIDNMIVMLEKYANHLEELVAERTSELDAEKAKTENLLYRMLPQTVAEELKMGRPIKAEHFDDVTLYFSDIVGFTSICASSTPIEVVNLLNSLYTLFDAIITRYDVYKVETIGDAYMIASGLPKRNGKRHIQEVADCALDILASVSTFCIPHQPDKKVKIRIGIHTGPVVAGVVGLAMPRYCLFGDTVNTASRMESTGLPLRIHLSLTSRNALEQYPGYHLACRGEIPVKGKGNMRTYFLCGKEGFKKDLPKYEEHSETRTGGEMRVSLTSLNSMASLVSSPSTCYSFVAQTPKTSQVSNISNMSRSISMTNNSNETLTPQEDIHVSENSQGSNIDEKFKSKQTGILEITCL